MQLRRRHRRHQAAVERLVDGELPPAARGEVLRHLDECWDCSATAETLLLVKHSLARLRCHRASLVTLRLRRFVDGLTGPGSTMDAP